MGSKVHPKGYRLGITKGWSSRWYSEKDYSKSVYEDYKTREFVKKSFYSAGISSVEIERFAGNRVNIIIHTARPAIIIGKKGRDIDALKSQLEKLLKKKVEIEIVEEPNPELNAQLIAENVATQLERRFPFRRAMKKVVQQAKSKGVQGIKVAVKGRLNGAEMKRKEWYIEGRLPLQTIRSDIDYGAAEAHTTYGRIGIKVWVYKGEIILKSKKEELQIEGLGEKKNVDAKKV